jgi:recombinational DNA repair protein (RecF pathway)
MTYATYHTEALVCGSYLNNTADKSFLLFTKRAGMLYASARSVREERSKQRYALQDFSLITVTLIKGKTGWRVGSVDTEGNIFGDALSRQARGSVVRVLKLLRRFIAGEEPHPELYDELVYALRYLAADIASHRVLAEEIIEARILSVLGYMSQTAELAPVLAVSLREALDATPDTLLPVLQSATAHAQKISQL